MAKARQMIRLGLAGLTITWASASALSAEMDAEWNLRQTTQPTITQPPVAPEGGLPDGEIAENEDNSDIAAAWYTKPTGRYGHGILGDATEAGGLTVETTKGKQISLTLPVNQVFEDRTPRLFDLGATGKANIITLLTDVEKGASIAVYGVEGESLKLLAQTPYIGKPNRWRNIAGIADFDGDGNIQIAEVVTPHIGGTLKFWKWNKKNRGTFTLTLSGEMPGFSNHQIGAREQGLSTIEDFDHNGVTDIALPSADRKTLRLIQFSGRANGKKNLKELANIPLPAKITQKILSNYEDGKVAITVGLEDGSWWKIGE